MKKPIVIVIAGPTASGKCPFPSCRRTRTMSWNLRGQRGSCTAAPRYRPRAACLPYRRKYSPIADTVHVHHHESGRLFDKNSANTFNHPEPLNDVYECLLHKYILF